MQHEENILKLRSQGLSYDQIQAVLHCSKATISYHCSVGQKEKLLERTKERRRIFPLRTKMESFKHRKKKNEFRDTLFKVSATNKKIISSKISQFSRMGKKTKRFYCKFMFKEKDLMNKIGDEPRCYWTGRKINLDNGKSYQLDHFVPKSKGGDNSLENCVLACKEANQGRSDITSEDYIKLSCEVAVHKGKEILAGMLAHDNEFREFLDEKSKLQ